MRLITCAALILLPAATAAAPDRLTKTLALAGRPLVVDVTVGDVRIEGADTTEVAIDVVRQAPSPEALARLPVTIDDSGPAVRIRAVQADGATDPALRADVTLRVPRAATIDHVRLFEGRLTLAGLAGAVTADVRRGPIEADDLAGTIRLETGIGDIHARRFRLSPAGLIRLRAFNGDVRLDLAERPPDARLLALALNGTIESSVPLTRKEAWGPRWAEATLGRGEPVISIDVITGTIAIAMPAS